MSGVRIIYEAVYLYDDEARARLISAAPEMVRVLLAIEWMGGFQEGEPTCPSCGWEKQGGTKHRSDCELDAALRKAGVR